MTELCATYSSHLIDLGHGARAPFSWIRLGNWHEPELIDEALTAFPDRTFLYHHNGNVPHDEVDRQAFARSLNDWRQRTNCPWLSFHLDYHRETEIRQVVRGEREPPLYHEGEAFDLLCDGVRQVQRQVDAPLILENVPSWPLPYPCLEVSPNFVERVLEATGCGLLLDTAHARIARPGFSFFHGLRRIDFIQLVIFAIFLGLFTVVLILVHRLFKSVFIL